MREILRDGVKLFRVLGDDGRAVKFLLEVLGLLAVIRRHLVLAFDVLKITLTMIRILPVVHIFFIDHIEHVLVLSFREDGPHH